MSDYSSQGQQGFSPFGPQRQGFDPFGGPGGGFDPFGRQAQGGMTQAELETLPYLQQEVAEQKKEFSLLTPLELIFDVLSRGQYATANLGEDIARAVRGEDVNFLESLWEGLTGKRKGDWKTTLFGGTDEGETGKFGGIFEDAPEWTTATAEIPVLGDVNMQDVFGFLGNVLLDPTTYLSFGATKAGKKAAETYTKHATKAALKSAGSLDDIAKFARKGFDPARFKKLVDVSEDSARNYLTKFAKKKDMARFMNKVTKTARKEGLRMTAQEAQQRLVKNALKNKDAFVEQASEALAKTKHKKAVKFLEETFQTAEKTPGLRGLLDYEDALRTLKDPNITKDQAQAIYKRMLGAAETGGFEGLEVGKKLGRTFETVQDYAREVNNMYSDEFMQQFKGMGERAVFDFFGGEFGKYQFKPNVITRTYDNFMTKLGDTKVANKFSDALYRIMNDDKSPVAWLRRAFGIRNPYQKMLRAKELDADLLFREYAHNQLGEVKTIFQGVDKDISRKVRDVLIEFEGKNVDDLLNPDVLKMFDIKDDQVEQVRALLTNVKKYTNDLNAAEKKLIDEGLLASYSARENYLPVVQQQKIGTGKPRPGQTLAPGFTKKKKFSIAERAAQEKAKIKLVTGLDDATVDILVNEKNWSTLNMDLEEMLMHRGLAHAQAKKHGDFVKSFREFGVRFDKRQVLTSDVFDKLPKTDVEKSGALIASTRMNPNLWPELGLSTVKAPGFENYMFDKDVARIIDRVNPIIGSDAGMNEFNKAFSKMSAFWRATATLSPGFHARNAKSNVWSLYMKDGIKAFNPARAFDSTIGAAYALGEDKFLKMLPERVVNRALNKRIADKTVKEWAEYARKRGLISQTTMGFDFKETVESMVKNKSLGKMLNPLDLENTLFSASKRFGSVIESSPKFSSFLNDVEHLAKYGDFSEEASDWAVAQSKKWFFDYEDLTDFEKNIMKKVIPFYTWLRKNVALQLTQVAEKKNMYSQFAKIAGLQRDESIDPADMPEWMRDEAYIPIGKGEEGKTRFLEPGLPYGDINIIPLKFDLVNGIPIPKLELKDAADELLSMADPTLKTFASLTSEKGYDVFRQQDFKATAPAPRLMRYAALRPEILGIVDAMIKGAGYDKGLGAKINDKGQLEIDSKVAHVIETHFLPIKRLGQVEGAITTFLPQIDEAIEKATGLKDRYAGTEKLFQTLSFLIGFKQKDMDMDLQESYRFRDALKKAEAARTEARKQQPGYKKTLDKYIKAREAKIKRYKSRL